jgi:hypothetical protein
LAAVGLERANVMPPRRDAAGKAFDHPFARLERRVAGLTEGLIATDIHGHALGDDLVPSQYAVQQLAAQGVLLKAGEPARLLVGHHHLGAFADLFEVTEREVRGNWVAVDHTQPQAVRATVFAGGGVI